ncbi:hypothetical protein ACTD5D_21585 [Nocardia takedensis]|uniref:hypothetical protein n=1 Tax=Nocardia takedensis TaxID=259390 RepID=UPI003F75AAEC
MRLTYCGDHTDAEYHPTTSTLRIITRPLAGTTYPYAADDDTAARTVAATHPDPHNTIAVVPTWRLRAGLTPAPITRIPEPLTPHDARHLLTH